jgi:hypothetical protein
MPFLVIRGAAIFVLISADPTGFRSHKAVATAPSVRVRVSPQCVPAFYKGLVIVVSHARRDAVFNVEFGEFFRSGSGVESPLGQVKAGRGGTGRIRDHQPLLADPGRGRAFLLKYGYDGPHAALLVVKNGSQCDANRR